jgi:CheY-like chemotaxis protein
MNADNYVLIVDDDPDAQRILSVVMEKLGVTVKCAEDGEQAMAMINAHKPTLVFLDLMMPVMNGFEVLFRLRSVPDTRRIPVIVVSAISQNEMLDLPGVSKVIAKSEMRIADVLVLLKAYIPDSDASTDANSTSAAAR